LFSSPCFGPFAEAAVVAAVRAVMRAVVGWRVLVAMVAALLILCMVFGGDRGDAIEEEEGVVDMNDEVAWSVMVDTTEGKISEGGCIQERLSKSKRKRYK
jgi:hypothetical protein